jgi:glycosyltransferase involved in cell wall biosynthesis
VSAPDVTVVIATHDRLALLPDAVESVRAQDDVEWELVVVDDGSRDGTADWLRRELRAPRERAVIEPANVGRPAAANDGLAAAGGRHVLFLDDDDLLLPGALRALVAALDAAPDATAAIGARLRREDGREVRIPHPRRTVVRDMRLELCGWWTATPGQVLARGAVLRAVGGMPSVWPSDDFGLLVRLASRGPFVLYGGEVLGYRVHAAQHTRVPGDRERRQRLIAAAAAGSPWPLGAQRAGLHLRAGDEALGRGEGRRALGRYARLVLRSPRLAASPVVRPGLWRNVLAALRLAARRA